MLEFAFQKKLVTFQSHIECFIKKPNISTKILILPIFQKNLQPPTFVPSFLDNPREIACCKKSKIPLCYRKTVNFIYQT